MTKTTAENTSFERTVRNAIEAEVGPIEDVEPLTNGAEAEATAFVSAGKPYIARVGARSSGFQKDRIASKRFGSDSLPVPKVELIARIGAERWLCVTQRASGTRLEDLPAEGLKVATGGLLELLAAVEAADVSALGGYGRLDGDGVGECRSWHGFLTLIANGDAFDSDAVPDRIDRGVVRAATDLVTALAPRGERPRRLIHGDLSGANVLIDGGSVTALLDWSLAAIGDPDYDAASLLFWREPCFEGVRAALQVRHADDAGWTARMRCYQLRLAVEELHMSAAGLSPVGAAWLEGRMRALMAKDAP